ncbi:hypothetical protein HMPREF9371_2350 [Neisseria shayeganii 871]|uniref:SnoaL-like domain-containing protein n=2 Tax=Neisseria shayeganii TaxID=607712 RepID=G4CL59_9NEIS|nr:hypothetical protein HMPREF9371_2350 [Neisseria shayeganii 871]
MNYQDEAQAFLGDVFSGNLDAALTRCADDVVFISTRPDASDTVAAYGTFVGKAGAARFFGIFGETLQAGEFNTHAVFGSGHHVAMYGQLKHTARITGRPFASDWALIMRFNDDGKLALYHFYEDTARLEWALGVQD